MIGFSGGVGWQTRHTEIWNQKPIGHIGCRLFAFTFFVLLLLAVSWRLKDEATRKHPALLAKVQKAGSVRVIMGIEYVFSAGGAVVRTDSGCWPEKARIASTQARLQQEISKHNVRE